MSADASELEIQQLEDNFLEAMRSKKLSDTDSKTKYRL